MVSRKVKDNIGKAAFAGAAVVCAISVAAIFAFLIINSFPAFKKIGFFDFLFGDNWSSAKEDTYAGAMSGSYGVFKMIVSSLAATIGALLVGGVSGYFTAIFIAFYCPEKLKRAFSSVINLLAGIPSVVYGFFGIAFLLPMLSFIAPNNGCGLLATSLILGIMILPTVVSLSKTSLEAVPESYYEGSLALGATHSQTVFKVMSPAAKSGITASLILGIGRALGETMAVVMVAGNGVSYPDSLFKSFRVLTANIVIEMGYAGELQEGALIACGVVLLIFVLMVNLVFNFVAKKAVVGVTKHSVKKTSEGKEKKEDKGFVGAVKKFFSAIREKLAAIAESKPIRLLKGFFVNLKAAWEGFKFKIKSHVIGSVTAYVFGVASALALALVIGFIFVKGLPSIFKDPSLLYGEYVFGGDKVTILPSIITTLWVVVLSIAISVPIGIMTAIFLNEYAKKDNFFVKTIRLAIDVLSGVPSIVYGLFGMITFVKLFTGSSSIIAGVCTISMMLLPTVVRSTEESLKSVSDSLREGSLALGAGKLRTIFKVVLPSALPGITSAIILTIGRVVSESAPFIYTTGSIIKGIPNSPLKSGATLAVALYDLSQEGLHMNEAYATAVVLIVVVLALNLVAEAVSGKLNKKLAGKK